MKMKSKNLLIVIGVCVVLVAGGIFFFTRGGGEPDSSEDMVHDPRRPQGAVIGDTLIFYDDARIYRDEFTVLRILGQTIGGYLAILWDSDVSRYGLQRITLVSECFTRAGDFFEAPPEWNEFIMAAVDERGWLYLLGRNRGSIYLYLYDAAGAFIEKHGWEGLPGGVRPHDTGTRTYVVGDTLVHITFGGFTMLSVTGEVLYRYEAELAFRGTVSGGYLYGLYLYMFQPYFVRKVEVPTGNVIWENSWHEETGNIADILFCGARNLLYLFYPTRLTVYDENSGQLYMLRDLTNSGFRAMAATVSPSLTSASVLGDGRLHFSLRYARDMGYIEGLPTRFFSDSYMEWIFNPLFGDAALARMGELEREYADTPVIRFLPIFDNTFRESDLLAFAADLGAFVEITQLPFIGGHRHIEYAEALIAALFANTANWDIIATPSTFLTDNEFALCAFVERGMVFDLLPAAERRFIEDNERYYTHLFRALLHNGGLYHLPGSVSVPFVLVPDGHPELEYLTMRAQNWTWAEFLQIVRRLEAETGEPQISANDAFVTGTVTPLPQFVPNPVTNVPPFYFFDEELLLALGRGERLAEFSESLELFSALADTRYNHVSGAGTFTFACARVLANERIIEARVVLPMPTMRGEYIFYGLGGGYAVLTVGASPALAAEFLIRDFAASTACPLRRANNARSLIRPTDADIIRDMSMEIFAQYEAVLYRANTYLRLPASVRLAINDAVLQYVHGALSRDAAVQRVADIMWIFVNE